MTVASDAVYWEQSFKRSGVVLKGAAVSIFLAGSTTAAPINDHNDIRQTTAPQVYTDQTGYIKISLNPDDFCSGQLLDIKVEPSAVCSQEDVLWLRSLHLLTDSEGGRYFKQVFAQDSAPTKTANHLRESDLWLDTNNDNHLHRFNGSSWVSMRDGSIAIIGYANSIFGETWENAARLNYWDATGDGELSIVSGSGVTGGNYLSIGDNSGNDQSYLVFGSNIPFDRTRRYRTHIRVKQTAGTGTVYCGFAALKADGETFIDKDGTETSSLGDLTKQHWHCCAGVSPGASWTEYEGITSGTDSTGTIVAGTTAVPGKLHENVAYIRPLILVNYNGEAGTTLVDMMLVENFGATTAKTFTAPDAPTNIGSSSSTYVGNEGTTLAKLTINADPPSDNYEFVEFAYVQTGSEPSDYEYPFTKGSYNSGTGKWENDFYGLTPGLNYWIATRAVNPSNASDGTNDYQHSSVTDSDAGVMSGDTDGPDAPTTLNATSLLSGVKLTWTPPSNDDLAYQIIYRHTTNVFGSASELTRVGGRESKEFHDRTADYSTGYYYWVQGYDFTENAGSVSSAVQAASGANQATDSDISGLNFNKLGEGTLSGTALTLGSGSSLALEGADITLDASSSITVTAGASVAISGTGSVTLASGSNSVALSDTGISLTAAAVTVDADSGVTIENGGSLTLEGDASTGGSIIFKETASGSDYTLSFTPKYSGANVGINVLPSTSGNGWITFGNTTYKMGEVSFLLTRTFQVVAYSGAAYSSINFDKLTTNAFYANSSDSDNPDLGTSSYYWGDCYICDGWKLSRYYDSGSGHYLLDFYSSAASQSLMRVDETDGYIYYYDVGSSTWKGSWTAP